jgi:kumamolisin
VAGRHVALRNSLRPARLDGSVPASPDEAPLFVTIHLRDRTEPRRRSGSRSDLAALLVRRDHAELSAQRAAALTEAADQIRRFADAHHLTVTEIDLSCRRIRLSASPAAIETAFATRLHAHEHSGRRLRFPVRQIRIPRDLRQHVHAVLGLDERPQVARGVRAAAVQGTGEGLLPSDVARLYGLQTGGTGAGRCIGIIQPAGGYDRADLAAACRAMNVPLPTTVDIAVGRGGNAFGQDVEADKEVALDLQVAIGVAPGARFAVYFTANNDQGLVDAVATAVHDTVNRPSVLVTSWGDAEGNWSESARRAMDAALADAANLGVTVVAAVGDTLATDGLMDGGAHVDYPASSPYVLACGGTRITLTADRLGITQEQVWNDRISGTGGGISDVYPVPAYQSGLTLPTSVNDGGRRRGVPDLTASAAADPGYRIVVHGNPVVMGGTSAVAPLCGGFLALINEQRRTPLGMVHERLYRGGSGLFRPVTAGDNRPFGSDIGYDAGAGWSACAGLGSPIGRAIIDSLTGETMA